ncbi:hypothetical protein B0J11DRAFT_576136 [Dendryphion nanum]|uniref:Uncharacterized protein n=1 Tax=Dendryphion nanum TaxID=256645 RepID=A0A9P9EE96_9PLEO|nr:hypothetical protein B0J11DRAFT_576136 [Dendryphion nanum]
MHSHAEYLALDKHVKSKATTQTILDRPLSESPLSSPTLFHPHPTPKFSVFAGCVVSKLDNRSHRWTLFLEPGDMPNSNTVTNCFVDAISKHANEFRCAVYEESTTIIDTKLFLKLGRTNISGDELRSEVEKCSKFMTVASLNEPGGWRWILAVLDAILVVKRPLRSGFDILDEWLEQFRKLEKIKLAHTFLTLATPVVADTLLAWDAMDLSQRKDGAKHIIAVYARPDGHSKFMWMFVTEGQGNRGLFMPIPSVSASQPEVSEIRSRILGFRIGRHTSTLERWQGFLSDLNCTKVIPETAAGLWIPPLVTEVIKGRSGHDVKKRLESVFNRLESAIDDMGRNKEHAKAMQAFCDASRNLKLEAHLSIPQNEDSAEGLFDDRVNAMERVRDESINKLRHAHDSKTHSLMGFLADYEDEDDTNEVHWQNKPMNSYMRAFRQRQEEDKLAIESTERSGRSFKLLRLRKSGDKLER